MRFDGPDYSPADDKIRLEHQHERIKRVMLDSEWRTLTEISSLTGDPESSISAQLRHLRKERFGAYIVDKRRRGERKDGLFEYLLRERTILDPVDEFETCDKCGGKGKVLKHD